MRKVFTIILSIYIVLYPFLFQRPYGSRDFEIGSCRQHGLFTLLRLMRPLIVFNFKIIVQKNPPKQNGI